MLSLPEGQDVFLEDPDRSDVADWVHRYHTPFHIALTKATSDAKFLFDCHSLWSSSAPGHYGESSGERADIVLGNKHYCTCSAETTQFFRSYFEELGYGVAVNAPYPGRYILGTYCSRIVLPGIQIEINRKLYLNEQTLDPSEPDITRLHDEFDTLVDRFCEWFKGATPAEDKPLVDLSDGGEFV